MAAQVNRTIEGRKTRTDQPTWYAIHHGLTGDDADERERWADTNLVQFRGQLSDEDFAALTRLQTTVRTNDGGAEATRVQLITRMANQVLREQGIDPTPQTDSSPDNDAAPAAMFHRALQDELSTFETSKSRPATAADAQAIVEGLAARAFKGGWLTAATQNDFLIKASHTPSVEDEVFLAQAGADDGKPSEGRSGTAPLPEPDPGSAIYRDADRQARDIVAEQEFLQRGAEREASSWMTGFRPGEPLPELPKAIAERLLPEQREEIQDIIAGGADTQTDPDTFKEIFLGLTSEDREERLKWAREPLFLYRPLLSAKDYANLALIQRNISFRDGVPIEGVGSPAGTLDDHAELAISLTPLGQLSRMAASMAREIYRAGRQALEKATGKNEPPPGPDVATIDGASPTGASEHAAKVIESAFPASQSVSTSELDRIDPARQEQLFEVIQPIREEQPEPEYDKDARPNGEEETAGKTFTMLGRRIQFKKPLGELGIRDQRTADLEVEGIGRVEIYTPRGTTRISNVITSIQNKHRQAEVILPLPGIEWVILEGARGEKLVDIELSGF